MRETMHQYITIQGDTWDLIAKKVYGDEKKLDFLMQHNFPLLDYTVFPAGIRLSVPELTADDRQDWPEWRKK